MFFRLHCMFLVSLFALCVYVLPIALCVLGQSVCPACLFSFDCTVFLSFWLSCVFFAFLFDLCVVCPFIFPSDFFVSLHVLCVHCLLSCPVCVLFLGVSVVRCVLCPFSYHICIVLSHYNYALIFFVPLLAMYAHCPFNCPVCPFLCVYTLRSLPFHLPCMSFSVYLTRMPFYLPSVPFPVHLPRLLFPFICPVSFVLSRRRPVRGQCVPTDLFREQ